MSAASVRAGRRRLAPDVEAVMVGCPICAAEPTYSCRNELGRIVRPHNYRRIVSGGQPASPDRHMAGQVFWDVR